MFLDELSPVAQHLFSHPLAFLGGLTSGLLRLNMADDPVKSWLHQQGATSPSRPAPVGQNGSGPKNITID